MLGQRIGNYLITKEIGQGGMGVVYEALHQDLGRRAAIKVLRPAYALDAELSARFLNEARAVNVIEHPGVVSAFDFGHTGGGAAYIVMDYLAGSTLRQRLEQLHTLGGRLGLAKALRLARQLASALAAAHAQQIVHRDLKPDNVMLVEDREVPGEERAKILDFGIAKAAFARTGAAAVQTQDNSGLGTPAYMAPEQWQAASSVTDKSDVYSLGVVLFELFAGRLPFAATEPRQLMKMHLFDQAPHLGDLDAAVPPALADLVARMLAKEPSDRPTMLQVLAALEPIGEERARSGDQTPAARPAGVTSTRDGQPPKAGDARRHGPVGRTLGTLLLGMGLGMGLGAGGVLAWQRALHRFGAGPHAAGIVSSNKSEPSSPWLRVDSGTAENLHAVFGFGPKDVWAVGGDGLLVHFDGQTWQRVAIASKSPHVDSMRAIWGSGPTDVWAVGQAGLLLHFDGTVWKEQPSGTDQTLYSLFGRSATDWWAGGRQGVLLHWNGHDLLPIDVPTRQHIRGIWAHAADDLWMVASSDANEGTILHWDGHRFGSVAQSARLNQVWGTGPRDVWVVGGRLGNQGLALHFDGTRWSTAEPGESPWLHGVWGSAPDDVWLAGESDTLFHWNGRRWTRTGCDAAESFRGLWGDGPSDLWGVGTRGLSCHYGGKEWKPEISGTKQTLHAVWQDPSPASAGRAYAVGNGGLFLRRQALTWAPLPSLGDATVALHDVLGVADGRVYAVGDRGTVLRWDGRAVLALPNPGSARLHTLWAANRDDIWMAGDRGTVLRWDGREFHPVPVPGTTDIYRLFGFSADDVWAVGEGGALWHYTGRGFTAVTSNSKATLRGVFGASADDLWVVGDNGTLLHGRAGTFVATVPVTPESLHAVYGNGPHDIWAVGSGGVTLHYGGGGWRKVLSGTTMALYGLSEDPGGELLAVGQWGTIRSY